MIEPSRTGDSAARDRVVRAPAAVGRGAVNRVNSATVGPNQEVRWTWTTLPGGGRFVSGYTLVARPHRAPREPRATDR